MVKSRQWQLASKPTDTPKLEGSDATFKLVDVDLPDPQEEEMLVKLICLSNDPAQRSWIGTNVDPERLYVQPVEVGDPMRARGLAEVVESKFSEYKNGDTVFAPINWSEYAVVKATDCQPAEDLPNNLSKTHYLGALGLTGLTAYFGLTEVGKIKPKDTVVVSGAAGATGSMAVQIAKKVFGCEKVIGVAGTDEKCRWVEKLGADLCLNYKSASFVEDMKKATPGPDGFADVYFDNVGGEILDLMFSRMGRDGRIIACGAISQYNNAADRTTGLKNWLNMVIMRITAQGFIVLDYVDKFPQAREVLRKAVAEGKLDIGGSETVVKTDFNGIPKTWMKLFDGSNQGKLVTQLDL